MQSKDTLSLHCGDQDYLKIRFALNLDPTHAKILALIFTVAHSLFNYPQLQLYHYVRFEIFPRIDCGASCYCAGLGAGD